MASFPNVNINNFPRENIYGHTKKLRFINNQVNQYINTHKVNTHKDSSINILDFGCGNGQAVSQFLMGDKIYYYGVDIHEPSLEYAKKNFSIKNTFFLKEIPDQTLFDIIVYADILEHLDNPGYFLQQHYKLLKPDGIIIGAVPNGFGPFEIEKRIIKWLGLSRIIQFYSELKSRVFIKYVLNHNVPIPYNKESGHVQFFTKKSLLELLKENQFKVEKFKHGAFIGATISEKIFRSENIVKLNASIADHLPYFAVSTWYFTARKKD